MSFIKGVRTHWAIAVRSCPVSHAPWQYCLSYPVGAAERTGYKAAPFRAGSPLQGKGVEREAVERRLAAILVADVAGYCRLMGQDEAGTCSGSEPIAAN